MNGLKSEQLKRTGPQLALTDNFDDLRLPILTVMAKPDREFFQGLQRFRKRIAFANIANDHAVHFSSAFISSTNAYRNTGLERMQNYLHIVQLSPESSLQCNGDKLTSQQVLSENFFKNEYLLKDIGKELACDFVFGNLVSKAYQNGKTCVEMRVNYDDYVRTRDTIRINLSVLDWQRVPVWIDVDNSHGAIVNKDGEYPESSDVVQYCVSEILQL